MRAVVSDGVDETTETGPRFVVIIRIGLPSVRVGCHGPRVGGKSRCPADRRRSLRVSVCRRLLRDNARFRFVDKNKCAHGGGGGGTEKVTLRFFFFFFFALPDARTP